MAAHSATPGAAGRHQPFLIDWGATTHPAAALPRLALRGLRATHPDPAAVSAVLDALGVRLLVEEGPPELAALLGTRHGTVLLTDRLTWCRTSPGGRRGAR